MSVLSPHVHQMAKTTHNGRSVRAWCGVREWAGMVVHMLVLFAIRGRALNCSELPGCR